jgi:hypothetical protein
MISPESHWSRKEEKWFLLAHNERNIFYIVSKMHISSRGLGPQRKSIFVGGQAARRCGILRSCGADAARVGERQWRQPDRISNSGDIIASGINAAPSASTFLSAKLDVTFDEDCQRRPTLEQRGHPAAAPQRNPAMRLDFAQLRDHSPATCDAEGALWRRKRCSNFREW